MNNKEEREKERKKGAATALPWVLASFLFFFSFFFPFFLPSLATLADCSCIHTSRVDTRAHVCTCMCLSVTMLNPSPVLAPSSPPHASPRGRPSCAAREPRSREDTRFSARFGGNVYMGCIVSRARALSLRIPQPVDLRIDFSAAKLIARCSTGRR